MAKQSSGKVGHNWLVDIMKLVSMALLVIGHCVAACWGIGASAPGYDAATFKQLGVTGNGYFLISPAWYGTSGWYSIIEFFILTTSFYWYDRFKKEQKQGLHKPERTLKLGTAYFGKSLSQYWPLIFIAISVNLLTVIISLPGTWLSNGIIGIWKMILNAVPYLLGLSALGWTHSETAAGISFLNYRSFFDETGAVIGGMDTKINFSGNLWFISSLMIFGVIWYLIFVKSETFGLFVWLPVNMGIFLNAFGFADGMNRLTELWGLSTEYWRCFGSFGWGIVLWWIVKYIKEHCVTPKGRMKVTIVGVLGFINVLLASIYNNGAQFIYMLSLMVVLAPVLSEKGYITPAINKFLGKIPGHQYVSNISTLMYMYLMTTAYWISRALTNQWGWLQGMRWENQMWIFLGFEVLWCIFYLLVIDRFIQKPLAKKIKKLFHVDEIYAGFKVEDASPTKTQTQ